MDPLTPWRSLDRGNALDLLLLDALPGVGPVAVKRLVDRFGTAARALIAPTGEFTAVTDSTAARARSDRTLREDVDRRLRKAEGLGILCVTWDDDLYPASLRPLADPPPVLFLRGDPSLLVNRRTVSVVGARRATARARDVGERLGSALARSGCVVASGLALGVDGAVHEGVLRAGGSTIAVLGTGPDVPYPRAHRRLFRSMIERGLLVTEFLPGTEALPHHFPRRNRILAGLSSATVVVEAGARSGALITVDHALDLGRDVWAVPGPIDAPTCVGSNRLLLDGARPLVSIRDFAAEFSGESVPSVPQASHRECTPPTGSLEGRVLDALAHHSLLADEIANELDVPVQTALALLTTMELHGEVERIAGMRYRRAA